MSFYRTPSLAATESDWSKLEARAHVRPRGGGTGPIVFDADRAMRATFVHPRRIAERFGMVALVGGFRLKLDESAALLWARLRFQVGSPHQIVACFPDTVVEPRALAGMVRFEPSGAIWRLPAEAQDEGDSVSRLRPAIYARQPGPQAVLWDFAPLDGRPPAGTDELFLTLRGPAEPAPEIECRLMLAVIAKGSVDELYFELRAAARPIT